jgi:hypothetical protein
MLPDSSKIGIVRMTSTRRAPPNQALQQTGLSVARELRSHAPSGARS